MYLTPSLTATLPHVEMASRLLKSYMATLFRTVCQLIIAPLLQSGNAPSQEPDQQAACTLHQLET